MSRALAEETAPFTGRRVHVTVRRHDIVADPESVEIIRYASFSGLADCDDPVEPWETTLIEGRDSVEQISKERRYTTKLVVEESDLEEWWLDRIGTAHYIKVSGPDVEQVRAAWIAAREAYLAAKGALGAGEEAGPHA